MFFKGDNLQLIMTNNINDLSLVYIVLSKKGAWK